MPRGLYVVRPGSVIVHEAPETISVANQVRIRSAFAAIKHGTTFHLFSGHSQFMIAGSTRASGSSSRKIRPRRVSRVLP